LRVVVGARTLRLSDYIFVCSHAGAQARARCQESLTQRDARADTSHPESASPRRAKSH
jgi:hypothetical protein